MKIFVSSLALSSIAVGSTIGTYCFIVAKRPESEKLHIVLDLDNTILQSYPKKDYHNYNFKHVRKHDYEILDENEGYFVWYRPFCHVTLWFLSKMFNVHMFTAATKDYGEACLEKVPDVFIQKLYRESVTKKDSHGKDLLLITDQKAILVDDQLRNKTGNQEFYHIRPFTLNVSE